MSIFPLKTTFKGRITSFDFENSFFLIKRFELLQEKSLVNTVYLIYGLLVGYGLKEVELAKDCRKETGSARDADN